MAERGGYQRPSKPAPVSGPGRLSRRTDGGPGQAARYMADGDYGEGQEMMSLQRSAPMSQAPNTPRPMAASQRPMRKPTPLDAMTERPDEPLTMGSPMGRGAGPEVLSRDPSMTDRSELTGIKEHLPSLLRMANEPGAPPSFVRFVKYIRDI